MSAGYVENERRRVVREAREGTDTARSLLAKLTLDDPIVCAGQYGDDSECYACGGQHSTHHQADCAWLAARQFLGLPTDGHTVYVPRYYGEDD